MNDFVTIFTAVTLANIVSMLLITAYNIYIDRRDSEKRSAALREALEKLDDVFTQETKPKSTKKATSPKRAKKD